MKYDTDNLNKASGRNKKAFVSFAINAFLFLTVGFFAPMEILLGNAQEFSFPLNNVWWILLVFALIITTIVSLIETVIPKKISLPIKLGSFALALCMYVQSLVLNGSMISLTGDKANYSVSLIVTNLAIWLFICVIVAVAYFFCKKSKIDLTIIIAFVSMAFIVMQLTGCVSLFLSNEKTSEIKRNAYFTSEGEFTLSEKKNLVTFIIDTCDGNSVEGTLKENPNLFNELTGFTYYPNMTTTYSRTFPSVPYFFTQNKCYFEKPLPDFVNKSYEKSTFWKDMVSLCDDVRLYTGQNYIGESAYKDIDNYCQYDSSKLSAINIPGTVCAAYMIGLYRVTPYVLKDTFKYDSGYVDEMCLKAMLTPSYYFNDKKYYEDLLNTSVSVDKSIDSAFRFYHMWGLHPGRKLDENANEIDDPTVSQTLHGNMKIINEYIEQMKSAGVYDNTTIVITADHGNSGGGKELVISGVPTCIMLVKPAGADSTKPCMTSAAPVCQEDWFATAIKSMGGDSSKYGTAVFDVPENINRDRYYYYSSLYSDIEGEIALREYKISGNAQDPKNWSLTGRNWDINYSENKVSKLRLETQEPDATISPVPKD